MKLIAKRMRGMQDVLPGAIEKWEYIEKIIKEQSELYGFKLIRTPVIEQTGLFKRATGEASDIVEKEMYTFLDKGGRDVSLRPEGPAGIMRAVLENGLHNQVLPLKLIYISSCYRYEKPQSGRLREFFQFGAEIIGGNATMADLEIMSLAQSIFDRIGLKNIVAQINAIGCEGCQSNYIDHVKHFFKKNEKFLCETCKSRLERSPLRIFDCKNEECRKIFEYAPLSVSYICEDCAEHFQRLKDYAYDCGIKIFVNPFLFRGLDYYTKTVFEFIDGSSEEKLAICGGGRYDNLSKELGGPRIMSVGSGIGMERLISVMERQGIKIPEEKTCDIYLVPLGAPARRESVNMVYKFRKLGIKAEMDVVGRFIKPQMRYADKIKAKFTVVIGTEEMNKQKACLKNMRTGEETEINLGETFLAKFQEVLKKEKDELEAEKLKESQEKEN